MWGERALLAGGFPLELESEGDPAQLDKKGWRPAGWAGQGDTPPHHTQGPKESWGERGAPGLVCP